MKTSKATMAARTVEPLAEMESRQSWGRKLGTSLSLNREVSRLFEEEKSGWEGAYSECSIHQAATRPAIAPLAPREVTVSLWRRTCDVKDISEPTTPEARYNDRKLPRPISSCTATVRLSIICYSKERGRGKGLTSQSNKPENHGIGKQMLKLLVTENTAHHTHGIRIQWHADKVLIQHSPCRGQFPQHPYAYIGSHEAHYCCSCWGNTFPHSFIVYWWLVCFCVVVA